MNFTVYADNNLIFNREIVGDNGYLLYNMIDPLLNETNERFSTFSYKALKGTPAYEYVGHLNTRIKIYRDRVLYWTGRVFDISPTINNICSIVCEDFLGVFNDTIVRPYSWTGTASDLLRYFVNQHNSQVNDPKFMISDVYCDINDEIVRTSVLYDKTWTNIKTKLIDKIGGFMWIEYNENEQAVLYYSRSSRSELHNKPTQKVKFSKNIVSYNVDVNADKLYTACVPLGCRIETDQGQQRLTISDVNDGKDFLVNETAVALYGIIYAPVSSTTWDDITIPSNLLLRGQEWIANATAKFIRSISISSIDTSSIDTDLQAYDFLDKVKCEAPDFNEYMIIMALSRDIGNPHVVKLTFGDSKESISGKSATNSADTIKRIEAIESDYVTTGEARVVAEETIENSSTILQLPDQILTEVSETYTSKSEFDEFTRITSTQISQLPNEFQLLFTQVLKGAGLSELSAYLRVLNGNLHLGRSDSEIKACLKNEILIFYTGADELASVQTALAYFSSGKLYVKTVQIESLTIGATGALFDIRIVGEGSNTCLFFSGRSN